jgi:predicted ferric reductase
VDDAAVSSFSSPSLKALPITTMNESPDPLELSPAIALENVLLLLLGAVLGAVLALLIAPSWLPELGGSLSGPEPKGYWYLARSSGLIAYALLSLAVAFGLSITNRLARLWPGGPTAVDMHQFTALLALAFALFHTLILLGDKYTDYHLLQLFVPFAARQYRPFWVGLGQLGFYLALPVTFSFYIRKRIGYRSWRLIHYGSFAVYLLITLHGLAAGTDTTTRPGLALYAMSGLSIYFLLVYRLLVSVRDHRLNRPSSATKPTAGRSSPASGSIPAKGVAVPPSGKAG